MEISLGINHAGKPINGRWYQEGFDYSLSLWSPTIAIGLRHDTWRYGVSYLGQYKSSALATASDQNYDECKNDHSLCWPLSHWYGSGKVWGFYGSKRWGDPWFFEAGAYVYRPTWAVTIPDWIPERDAQPRYLHVEHTPKWQVSPQLTVGYQFKSFSVSCTIRRITAGGDDYPAIYDKASNECKVTLGFTY